MSFMLFIRRDYRDSRGQNTAKEREKIRKKVPAADI